MRGDTMRADLGQSGGGVLERRPDHSAETFEHWARELGIQGVIKALEPWVSVDRRCRIEQVVERRLKGVTVALVGLHDPHNGAAVLRTAESLGIQHVHAVQSVEPFAYSPKVAVGCEKWITVHRYGDFETVAAKLEADEFTLWAAVPGALARLEDFSCDRPVALVFGNERDGLSPSVIERCDARFSLPMWGFTQSYNLSVSVGLSLSEVSARYRALSGRSGDLGDEEKSYLRALWLFRSVRAAPLLLEKAGESKGRTGRPVKGNSGREAD